MARRRGGKRARGEGSIYQIEDGTWRGAISIGGGKRKYARGDTQADVVRQLTELKAQRDQGLPISTTGRSLTLGQFLDHWIESVGPSKRPKTMDSYAGHIRVHLKPALGHVRLAELTTQQVQRAISGWSRGGLKARTVQRIHATLRAALNKAEQWGMVTRNVAATRLVDLPKIEEFERQPLTLDEARRFLDAVRGHRLEALYAVALALGLRQGEALGLRWQDLDLDAGRLSVRWQMQRNPRGEQVIEIDGNRGLVPVKTHRSRRPISVPDALVAGIRAHRALQRRERLMAGDAWQDFDLVFTTTKGRPLDGSEETRRFQRLLAAAGIPRRRFHEMRHSCGTMLAALGVPLRDVQAILGHANIQTTMTYVHATPEAQAEAARRIGRALFGESVAANTAATDEPATASGV